MKYWHELTDEEVNQLFERKITIGDLMENYKQPDWCDYTDALAGQMGCWSLMDAFGTRKNISHEFCKDCDCYASNKTT